MKYIDERKKEDLIGTVKSIKGVYEYLAYNNEIGKRYNVTRVNYNNERKCEKRLHFNTDYANRIVGQYEVTPDIIVFKIEMPTGDYGKIVNTYYRLYSIKEDKEIEMPKEFKNIFYHVESIMNLKEKEEDDDRIILHMSSSGTSSGYLENNSVDFFVEVPSFKILPNAYSLLRNQVIETNGIDDIMKIINEDICYERTIDLYEKQMSFQPKNPRAEMLLLKK